ncbi:MAG: hypothetical protein JNM63_20200, partial [Spirochaetia bacterium]|nr:hypothetical protein [Spirochaetia bacterium]
STAYAIGTVNLTGNTISHSRKSGLCISSGGINTVNFNNNTVDGTGASQGVSVNPAFSGSLSFNGGTVKNTQEGALYWTPSSGGSLSVQGVAFQKINKSGTSSVDVITIGAGAMTSLRIQNCVHSQPDFPLQRFIEEQADAATQIFAGNQSTEDSFINGQVVPTI